MNSVKRAKKDEQGLEAVTKLRSEMTSERRLEPAPAPRPQKDKGSDRGEEHTQTCGRDRDHDHADRVAKDDGARGTPRGYQGGERRDDPDPWDELLEKFFCDEGINDRTCQSI